MEHRKPLERVWVVADHYKDGSLDWTEGHFFYVPQFTDHEEEYIRAETYTLLKEYSDIHIETLQSEINFLRKKEIELIESHKVKIESAYRRGYRFGLSWSEKITQKLYNEYNKVGDIIRGEGAAAARIRIDTALGEYK